jgi:hypothetical protein
MKGRRLPRILSLAIAALISFGHLPAAWACAACFGKSDSAMARGMNMGIFSLLVVVVCVLASVAGFFVFLARRSARLAAAHQQGTPQLITRS